MFRKVAVGISGGVDSAVAALLLKQKCFEVQGVFMQNWDIRDERGVCSSEEDYKDAKFVCEKLNIKLHHVNFTKEYWNDVFCPLIKDYQSGLTPNPDVLCNRKIKFNYFYKFAREVLKVDAIATGHYARTNFDPFMENFDPDESARLLLAKDTKKDQTFFLCQIQQEALKRTIFPLGDIMKSEVKNIAGNNGLEKISLKPESMGICFIGSRKFQDFIQEYIPDRPGVFVDIDTGRVVGEHNGIHQWTLGQRARLPGLAMAYFIAQKDAEKNIIYVEERDRKIMSDSIEKTLPSPEERYRSNTSIIVFIAQGTDHPILYTDLFFTGQPHWIHSRPPELVQGNILECLFKFQHTQEWIPCEICETPLGITIRLSREKRAITGGQYAVFAKNGECLGSAKIRNSGVSKFSCDYSTNLKNTVTI